MTLEKPWAKPFRKLIDELVADWGGEVRAPDRRGVGDLYLYPDFSTEVDGVALRIGVSEFPGGTAGGVEAADNIEYLRLELMLETPYSLTISPEGMFEKFQKLIGVESEFETGVKDFDKRFMLRTKSEADERLLCTPEFQLAVLALGKVARVAVKSNLIIVSRAIRRATDLDAANVRELVAMTLALARLCV